MPTEKLSAIVWTPIQYVSFRLWRLARRNLVPRVLSYPSLRSEREPGNEVGRGAARRSFAPLRKSHRNRRVVAWTLVCYKAAFSVVTQRSSALFSYWGGALRDDTRNGCVTDYVNIGLQVRYNYCCNLFVLLENLEKLFSIKSHLLTTVTF